MCLSSTLFYALHIEIYFLKVNNKMIFYLRNVVKYYSKVGDIKTIIISCLKANWKNGMLIFKLKRF